MKSDFNYYRAFLARDSRFDGRFFVAVKTTGIYCRPVCPARPAREKSCLFMATAAAAEREGFRPCLRCRPELAPGKAALCIEEALFAAIRARAIRGDSVEAVAARSGFSARQLRRLMVQAFGVTPVQIMQTERLLFSKKLLQETAMEMAQVAMSAGFKSLRRFNALFRTRYGQAPTALRRPRGLHASARADVLRLRLSYRPPLAWREIMKYLARRAVPGVEAVSLGDESYARTVAFGSATGWIEVRRSSDGDWLEVMLPASLAAHAWTILNRLRALFDLDANPISIDAHLGTDALLRSSVRQHPGLRVPGAWATFELAVRAVLGQQVSVAGASTLAARLALKFGRAVTTTRAQLHRLAPSPADLAASSPEELATIGLPQSRARALHELALAAHRGDLDFGPTATVEQAVTALRLIRGIGEWTAQYVAMRALRFPDAFPAADLGVRKAMAAPGQPLPSEKQVLVRAAAWRPWRAYAALHLWQTLHDTAVSAPT